MPAPSNNGVGGRFSRRKPLFCERPWFSVPGGQAVISSDGAYRYELVRRWGRGKSIVVFVMLNPSTADARRDDATIRRCIGFARDWGHDALVVVNLFAYRATDPADLAAALDPVGPENDGYIQRACRTASRIVCAWGAHPIVGVRQDAVLAMIPRHVECLGLTAAGRPRHPLYLASDTQPFQFQLTSEGSLTSGKIGSRGQSSPAGGAQGSAAKSRRTARAPAKLTSFLERASRSAAPA